MPFRNTDELYADWHLTKYSIRDSEVCTYPATHSRTAVMTVTYLLCIMKYYTVGDGCDAGVRMTD